RIPDKTRLKRAADSVFSLTCNNLRTAAASGWDFSSRWMRGRELYTTNTRNTVPVDLNCLVFNLQQTATKSQMLQMFGAVNKEALQADTNLARTVFNRTFFNDRLGWFCDYNIDSGRVSDKPTLAGMFPLYFKLADKKSAARVADFLRRNFLKEGGVVTTLQYTGQQWDAPNGWAPLQWITVVGLENYGYHQLAKEIAIRWVNLNKKVFRETGKLMEKYDVVNLKRKAGGGEYPSQDGFGWTNGVLLALLNRYDIRP
ncbi:MAG TPA: trehalase family glycosidase, partial [Chitinophagaceae bacterium]